MRLFVWVPCLSRALSFAAVLGSTLLLAQNAHFVAVTPGKATILVGESQRFRVVDQNGRMQRTVSWRVSEDGAFDYRAGDELVLTAKLAGHFRITARTGGESAEAEINVMEGTSLPQGTAKWSAPQPAGCKLDKVVPATPTANGPDIFGLSSCPDGSYVSAYTAEGIQLWRHKVSGSPALPTPALQTPSAAVANSANTSTRVNLNSASICDLVSVGTAQDKIRDLLKSRNLAFSNESSNGQVWMIEEPGAQCRLWFDEKSVLHKKRKTLVAE